MMSGHFESPAESAGCHAAQRTEIAFGDPRAKSSRVRVVIAMRGAGNRQSVIGQVRRLASSGLPLYPFIQTLFDLIRKRRARLVFARLCFSVLRCVMLVYILSKCVRMSKSRKMLRHNRHIAPLLIGLPNAPR